VLEGAGDSRAGDVELLIAGDRVAANAISPLLARSAPVSRLNIVVLPAPFGPISPRISPT